jgi:hypothetical protein
LKPRTCGAAHLPARASKRRGQRPSNSNASTLILGQGRFLRNIAGQFDVKRLDDKAHVLVGMIFRQTFPHLWCAGRGESPTGSWATTNGSKISLRRGNGSKGWCWWNSGGAPSNFEIRPDRSSVAAHSQKRVARKSFGMKNASLRPMGD